jgi:hypothetical protein
VVIRDTLNMAIASKEDKNVISIGQSVLEKVDISHLSRPRQYHYFPEDTTHAFLFREMILNY